ncbi:polysaccharide deacetylase family protein [Kocuria marina]|uniref:polysaccharide deacetylase family protein n=1 Tax=Kocuria marina TaxID=223184 RepID=UPI0022E4D1BD|nr:polysaccharide deacetylase family protein [Kocuria marina]
MDGDFKLTRRARIGWLAGMAVILTIALVVVFGLTSSSLVEGQASSLAKQYTDPELDGASSTEPEEQLPASYGRDGGKSTLVLYDNTGAAADANAMYAIATGNLLTHFGRTELKPVADYTDAMVEGYDAAVYIGADHRVPLPQAFLDDVRSTDKPVMWLGRNIEALAGPDDAQNAQFRDKYGWDPRAATTVDSSTVTSVEYKGEKVHRETQGAPEIVVPFTGTNDKVEVLATSQCTKRGKPTSCTPDGSSQAPWAIRSANLTYLAEVPLDYIDANDVYLIYTDLFYDLVGSDAPAVKQAAVRLEDVGPESDPKDLRRVADYLASENVPFQVAVIPIQIGQNKDGSDWYGLSLTDRPEVVDALKYMQGKGGTLIQHGTTHQMGTMNNPYSGRSGEDYEFYQFGCTSTDTAPYTFEECTNDSYITPVGRVAQDDVDDWKDRLDAGRSVMEDAGLGEPTIFETPHYGGSVNSYVAMAQEYDARYEQGDYYASILTGQPSEAGESYSQQFPFTVSDIYGGTVYPENLGNITEGEQNNHAIRDPTFLISRAKANLTVRESTASFFFHPYLDLNYLKQTVHGIKELGYEFTPVTELK